MTAHDIRKPSLKKGSVFGLTELRREPTQFSAESEVSQIVPAYGGLKLDERTHDAQNLKADRDRLAVELSSVLDRDHIEVEDDGKALILESVVQIHQLNITIGTRYIEIGQLLLRIYNQSVNAYNAIVSPYSNVIPIGQNVALKLRRIAEKVNELRLDLARFPSAYTTVYEIVTLEPEVLSTVISENRIHPRIGRNEIKNWKKLPEAAKALAGNDTASSLRLRLSERQLDRDRLVDDYERRIAKIDAEIRELKRSIKDVESANE